ncbi:MAG TPA: hypothetical protein PKJ63_14020 [Cyclobacteriaceae bacterium]|nr:hypothetical protein [Cyclobacteriaceae bacterium]
MVALLKTPWVGFLMKGMGLLGMVVIGIGVITYFRVRQAAEDFIAVQSQVTEWRKDKEQEGGQVLTLSWEFEGRTYQKTESSPLFTQLNFHQGDRVKIYVNPGDPNEMVLPDAEPFLQELAWRIVKAGITLLMISVGLWALRKFS